MEIKISRTSRTCCATGREFEHGEEIVSLVRLAEESFERRDYAHEVWEDSLGEGAFAVWFTRFRDPKKEEEEDTQDHSPLRRVFYASVEGETRAEMAKAYLAAQILRRQKAFRLLKESASSESEAAVALFADRQANRLIEVRDPNLSFAELEQARTELMAELAALEEAEANADAPPQEGPDTNAAAS